jgi:hypothetical protein
MSARGAIAINSPPLQVALVHEPASLVRGDPENLADLTTGH